MGLDITFFRKLTPIDCVFDIDGEPIDPVSRQPIDDYVRLRSNDEHFPGRADDINFKLIYSAAEENRKFGLSYSGYFVWRDILAKIAGYPLTMRRSTFPHETTEHTYAAGAWAASGGPFWELIYFSDCEGTLGTATCAKLAKDFADFQDAADAVTEGWFKNSYNIARAGFEMAADGGAAKLW